MEVQTDGEIKTITLKYEFTLANGEKVLKEKQFKEKDDF